MYCHSFPSARASRFAALIPRLCRRASTAYDTAVHGKTVQICRLDRAVSELRKDPAQLNHCCPTQSLLRMLARLGRVIGTARSLSGRYNETTRSNEEWLCIHGPGCRHSLAPIPKSSTPSARVIGPGRVGSASLGDCVASRRPGRPVWLRALHIATGLADTSP